MRPIPRCGKMLQCDNTAFHALRRIKLKNAPIVRMMDEPEDLARRFFALWGEYLGALSGDPQTLALWQRWLAPDASPVPGERGATGPAPGAAAAAGASGERDAAMAELTRRVGE